MNTSTQVKLPWMANGATYCTGLNGERICTGSQMGRRDCIPDDRATVKKLRLRKVPMVDYGCYDRGGAYWGQGETLYCAFGESDSEQVEAWFRAENREEAKQKALESFPNARFFN